MRPILQTLILLPALALALDDIPLYLDVGCTHTSVPGSFAQGPSDMELVQGSGTKEIPINCVEFLSGTDAIEIGLARSLKSGEYWDMQVKTPVDRYIKVTGYTDIRFWAKNKMSGSANFHIAVQNASYSIGSGFDTSVAGDGNWHEIVIQLSRLTDTGLTALQLSQPKSLPANAIDLLVDSITITDGTRNGSLGIPAAVHNPRAASWPSYFLIGGLDNQELGKSSIAYQAGGDYRYQYAMAETFGYYSPTGNGYFYDYVTESNAVGVKTALVYYNLGKSAEGYSVIAANLASSSYMSPYFYRYDSLLNQMKSAGGKANMIVLEPDMYGFLMRGPNGAQGNPIDDPTTIPVNMGAANAISGKTYEANLKGWATYMVQRAKIVLGDSTIVGHMPNHWGVSIPGMVGNGRKEAHMISGMTIARFLNRFGPDGKGDVVFVEKADRDANIKTDANWMWDSTGYSKFFLWTRSIAHGTSLPICGWQISEAHSDFSVSAKRDNAVEYFLAHPDRWVDGGFAGILFGAGDASCTNYGGTTDSGWYRTHMATYSQDPYSLPSPVGVSVPSSRPFTGLAMVADRRSVRFEGFAGTARASFLDAQGRVFASFSVHAGQSLDRSVLPTRLVYVRLVAPNGSRSFALLP